MMGLFSSVRTETAQCGAYPIVAAGSASFAGLDL